MLQADDERESAPAVVVLGWKVWQTRYRGSSDVIGRIVRVNGVPSTVVGVIREGFGFPMIAEVWQPLSALHAEVRNDRQDRLLFGFARLRPSVTLEQARAELQGVNASLADAYPDTNRNIEPRVEVFRSGIGGPVVALMAALTGAVAFVLLIACANVANLGATQRSRYHDAKFSDSDLDGYRGRHDEPRSSPHGSPGSCVQLFRTAAELLPPPR